MKLPLRRSVLAAVFLFNFFKSPYCFDAEFNAETKAAALLQIHPTRQPHTPNVH